MTPPKPRRSTGVAVLAAVCWLVVALYVLLVALYLPGDQYRADDLPKVIALGVVILALPIGPTLVLRRLRKGGVLTWLDAARFDGGLCIPGRVADRNPTLTLRPDGVRLTLGGALLTLPWEGRTADPVGWRISETSVAGEAGPPPGIGVALPVADIPQDLPAACVRKHAPQDLPDTTRVIELDGSYFRWAAFQPKQRDTVDALCRLLAERPQLRVHLDDRARMEDLIAAMQARAMTAFVFSEGFRRLKVEVQSALAALGYIHHIGGRPIPGDSLDDVETIVTRVFEHWGEGRWTADFHPSRDDVAKLVRRWYADPAPWPFAALTR